MLVKKFMILIFLFLHSIYIYNYNNLSSYITCYFTGIFTGTGTDVILYAVLFPIKLLVAFAFLLDCSFWSSFDCISCWLFFVQSRNLCPHLLFKCSPIIFVEGSKYINVDLQTYKTNHNSNIHSFCRDYNILTKRQNNKLNVKNTIIIIREMMMTLV